MNTSFFHLRSCRVSATATSAMRTTLLLAITLLAAAVFTGNALAVHPSEWVHTTEADFSEGESEGTVVTNFGDIKLSAATQTIGEMPEKATVINDVQKLGDVIYLAAGPQGWLMRFDGQTYETLHELPDAQIFAIDVYDGKLLVAISAEKSRLAVLDNGELKTLVEIEGTRYIWDVIVNGKTLYLATGIEGKLLAVDLSGAEAKVTELLDVEQPNLLCLARDGAGRLYVGTDKDGLIYRVTIRGDGSTEKFVVYDAGEPEIGSLLVTSDGHVYAGTADAEQARPGRLATVADAETGRPQGQTSEPQAPDDEQPEVPEPGDVPNVPPPADPLSTRKSKDAEQPQAAGEALAAADQAEPTVEQRDRLREVIRERLDQARESGRVKQQQASVTRRRPRMNVPTSRPSTARSDSAPREGNAIYRIDPRGFVTEVFRESVMILKIVQDNGSLLVATGNEGQVYRVDLTSEETIIIAKLDPQQITSMLIDGETILLGTSNPGSLVRMSRGYASEGQYTSTVLDATQISLWGKLRVSAEIPSGTTLTVRTRSGNVNDPKENAWSDWSEPTTFDHDADRIPLQPLEMTVASSPARFIQYRLTLTGSGEQTSVVDRVQLMYVMPNMRPVVTSILAQYPGESGGAGPGPASRPRSGSGGGASASGDASVMNIEWEASDPNNDALRYTLQLRPAGTDKWLTLAENTDATSHEWQTRLVPDGRYILRVTANDGADNTPDMAQTASRQSDPVLVDNTPPVFEDLRSTVNGTTVVLSGASRDALSPIRSIHYSVDATDEYKPVLSDDLIYDSTRETFTVKISDLSPGPHVVTLRAMDARGNTRFESVIVEVK